LLTLGENRLFLPGFPIPEGLSVTGDDAAVSGAEIVVSVVPSEFLRATITRLCAHLHNGQIIVSATKGVEDRSLLRMTEVIAACLMETGLKLPMGAFSGPSFALEVAQGQPTAITVAFDDAAVAARVQSGAGLGDAAALHFDGCDWRGDGRGAEERNRHRRRSCRQG
jgi:glycerol-3-phosphate dehydrogenase (NAD(P)+)